MIDSNLVWNLMNAIENAGYEPRSYSGRGMYGKECLGVTVDRETSVFQLAAQIITASDDPGAMADFLSDVRVAEDSMGMGTIVYFPRIDWIDRDADDEEEPEGEE